jgi:hypothetical protein
MPTTTKASAFAVGGQLLADLRADELVAPQLPSASAACSAVITCWVCCAEVSPLQRQADHHVARGAEVLHLRVAVAHLGHGVAHLAQVGRLGVGHLDHRAAGELHRQVQPARDQEEHRQREGDERDDVEHQRVAHEG